MLLALVLLPIVLSNFTNESFEINKSRIEDINEKEIIEGDELILNNSFPEIIFRDQNRNQIQAAINYEQRNDGRLNVLITFSEQDYVFDEISIIGLSPLIQGSIEISLGRYRFVPENPEHFITEFDSHLIGLNQNLDFETATIKLKKRNSQEINYLLECENWNTNSFDCSSAWRNLGIDFTQDENSITFTTTHFSGWTGTSFMYDNFETQGISDYCQTSNATASGWTDKICDSGAGFFLVGDYGESCFMDDQCGNITSLNVSGGNERIEVYKSLAVGGVINARVYFEESCENPLNIPQGQTNFWNLMTLSNDTAGTGMVMMGFNQNENIMCGGYNPNPFTCTNSTPESFNCSKPHYVEIHIDPLNDNLTCYFDGRVFCSEQGLREYPNINYLTLGKGKNSNDQTTGTIFVDEYRSSNKYIGGYPKITNLTELYNPIPEDVDQQLNATIKDLDGDLNTVWIEIGLSGGPYTNYTITNHVGDEYYFYYGEGNYTYGNSIKYFWYANDSNGQLKKEQGMFFVSAPVDNETQAREAILEGINNVIPNSSKTYDQQIYISYPNHSQDKGYFDVFAIYDQESLYGVQRWTFNYLTGNETFENMTSLRNTVNILELQDLTYTQIVNQVESFINDSLY